jgi:hypothetical protein
MPGGIRIADLPELNTFDGTEAFIFDSADVTYKGKVANALKVPHTHTLDNLIANGTPSNGTFLSGSGWTPLPSDYGRMIDLGSVLGDVTLNCATSNIFMLTLAGNITVSLSNLPASPPFTALLRVEQGGSGSNSIAWSSIFKHPRGVAAAIGTVVGNVEFFVLQYLTANRVEVFKSDGPY